MWKELPFHPAGAAFGRHETLGGGSCCETLAQNPHIRVQSQGGIQRLFGEYRRSLHRRPAVVCPIYAGSGMKTKTVEALKYGKYIFATPEAFEELPAISAKSGGSAKTATNSPRASFLACCRLPSFKPLFL
jgi:hypothetical protein